MYTVVSADDGSVSGYIAGAWDLRLWAIIALVFCVVIAVVGLKYVIKADMVLIVVLTIAIATIFLGALLPADIFGDEYAKGRRAEGFLSYGQLGKNWAPGEPIKEKKIRFFFKKVFIFL